MIRLEPPRPEPGCDDPTWTRWREQCEAARQALIRYYEQDGEPATIERRFYRRRSIVQRYYHGKKGSEPFAPFYRKCVYCEAARTILHVEHFRPRNSVTDAWPRRSPDCTNERHPGYYWLAYEIDNLLLACEDCNHGYKQDQFPLMDERTRAWASSDDLTNETPVLLNPFVDDPMNHIGIDLGTGRLTSKTERGRRTIELLGLNRERLPESRRRLIWAITHAWRRWHASDATAEQRAQAFEQLLENMRGRCEFTLTARLVLAHLREHG